MANSAWGRCATKLLPDAATGERQLTWLVQMPGVKAFDGLDEGLKGHIEPGFRNNSGGKDRERCARSR